MLNHKTLSALVLNLVLLFGSVGMVSCSSDATDDLAASVSALKSASDAVKMISLVETSPSSDLCVIHFSDGSTVNLNAGSGGVLSSITQNPDNGDLTITLADGSRYTFAFAGVFISSINVDGDTFSTSSHGRFDIEFSVLPATTAIDPASFDAFSLASVQGGVPSANLRVVGLTQCENSDGIPVAGRYTATVEDLGKSTRYSEQLSLTHTSTDYLGQPASVQSSGFEVSLIDKAEIHSLTLNGVKAVKAGEHTYLAKLPYSTDLGRITVVALASGDLTIDGAAADSETTISLYNPATFTVTTASGLTDEFTVAIRFSDVPVVYVQSPAPIVSKDDWVKKGFLSIFTPDEDGQILEKVQYKGRGNSTWGYPKKPYAIKLDKKTEILGMPRHKRWVLLANYLDKTLMRNAVSFEVGRQMDALAWTPRGRFVDLVFNGKFVGNYYLCEQIKIDENRVNITEMEATDVDPTTSSGGFLLEYDSYFDEVNRFRSERLNMPVNIKEPDEEVLNDVQLRYIKDYINTVERILARDFALTDISSMIDVNSFIDWWIVYELVQNAEPAHPKSCYMYKDRSDVLKAGPLWDFDWETFRDPSKGQKWLVKNTIYYSDLFRNKDFIRRVKNRWNEYKPRLEAIVDFIDRTYEEVKQSGEINTRLWNTPDFPNGEGTLSYKSAVDRLRSSYVARLAWMDAEINKW